MVARRMVTEGASVRAGAVQTLVACILLSNKMLTGQKDCHHPDMRKMEDCLARSVRFQGLQIMSRYVTYSNTRHGTLMQCPAMLYHTCIIWSAPKSEPLFPNACRTHILSTSNTTRQHPVMLHQSSPS